MEGKKCIQNIVMSKKKKKPVKIYDGPPYIKPMCACKCVEKYLEGWGLLQRETFLPSAFCFEFL